MPSPRHLWSGDWERESAASADELAGRYRPPEAPAEPEAPTLPAGPSALERARRALREANTRTVRRVALIGVAALAIAGGAYAIVGALSAPSAASPPVALPTPVSTSREAWLGVDTTSFPVLSGALVVDVAPGSPADVAGLQPGDVITQIGSHPVQTPADLDSALAGLHAGQQVQIQYQLGPGMGAYTTQVTLQSRPAGP